MLRLLIIILGALLTSACNKPGDAVVAGESARVPSTNPEPVQADGDAVGFLPLEITSETKAIRVLVP